MALHEFDDGICTTCADAEPLDDDSAALLTALNEFDGQFDGQRAAFDPSKHLRNPKGSPGGGRFRSNVDKLKDAIAAHKSGTHDGHPFDGFSREQLRKVAKARGVEIGRGESKESISAKLLGHLDDKSLLKSHEQNSKHDAPTIRPRTVEQMQADQDAAHADPLTPERKYALQSYSASAYSAINGKLRGRAGHDNYGPAMDQMIADIRDSMIPLPHATVVERASGWAGLPDGFRGPESAKKLIGETITDLGFASTSVPGANAAIPPGDSVHMVIEAPAGTKGRFLKDISRIPDENEYLIDAGSRYEVLSVDGSNPTVIRMRVVV